MQKLTNFYHTNAKLINLTLAILAPSLIIVSALWLPFGFTTMGSLEEWGALGLFTVYGPIFFEHASGPLAHFALRPLMVFPLALAYALDANSFDYWHIFTILSLVIKGAAASYLIWVALSSRFWAALMGILVLLFPADTLQLVLRPLEINWALASLLLGSSLFIVAYENKRSLLTYGLALISSILLSSAIFMYEATCALVLMPFMVLFVRDGLKKTVQQCISHVGIIMLWMTALGVYIIYFLVLSPKINSYQSQIMDQGNIIQVLVASLPKLFSVGVLRSLIGGWFDAIRMTLKEYGHAGYLYLTIVTAIISTFLLFMMKIDNQTNPSSAKKSPIAPALRLGLVGMLFLMGGYAPSLLVPAHLLISQRTFLFATPGAAMVWIAFLIIVFHGSRWLATLLAFILIFVGLGAQLFQFEHYNRISNTQRFLLKNIIENFDGDLKNKTLVILDGSNQLDRTWMFFKSYLADALTYFYHKPIQAIEICYLPTKEWRSPDLFNRMGTCIENKDSWTFRSATPVIGPDYPTPSKQLPDIKLAKNQAVVITINPDGSVSPNPLLADYKTLLHQGNSLTAIRYRNILTPKPSYFNFKSLWASDKEQYKWSFGDWWSLELPIKGSGWREAEWTVNYFYHEASSWKTQEKATLMFDLIPAHKPYFLHGQFDTIYSQTIKDSIQIRINQKTLSLHWGENGEFEAVIPPNVLIAGINTIEFNSKVDPKYFGLSLQLKRYEILTH